MPEGQDGRPIYRTFYAKRIADRGIDEAIGLCRGIIADGLVDQKEAEYILSWLERNKDASECWPCNILAARLTEYLKDGHLDKKESKDLLSLMTKITGDQIDFCTSINTPSGFFDSPLPEIYFNKKGFCFTGEFAFGPRKVCEESTKALGGQVKQNISKKVDYLVVGSVGSEAWIHSSFGRKIEQAWEKKRKQQLDLYVVPEDHWANYLIAYVNT